VHRVTPQGQKKNKFNHIFKCNILWWHHLVALAQKQCWTPRQCTTADLPHSTTTVSRGLMAILHPQTWPFKKYDGQKPLNFFALGSVWCLSTTILTMVMDEVCTIFPPPCSFLIWSTVSLLAVKNWISQLVSKCNTSVCHVGNHASNYQAFKKFKSLQRWHNPANVNRACYYM